MDPKLEEVRNKFAQWRKSKKIRREKIPDELMRLASACAVKHGKGVVARLLGLEYAKLEKSIIFYRRNENQQQKNSSIRSKISSSNLNAGLEFFEGQLTPQKRSFFPAQSPREETL